MKKMINKDNFTDKDWEELASSFSEETDTRSELLKRFLSEDKHNTEKRWEELRNMNDNTRIDVDRAWNKVWSRLNETGSLTRENSARVTFMRSPFMKIAAAALILICLGAAAVYLIKTDSFSKNIVAVTGNDQTNLKVILPDGSNVFLNRNTKMSYRANFGKTGRKVDLTGEAFFEITSDVNNPFIVDAGKARVKVLGTSFNVITNNVESAVEVYVQSGKVMLSDNSGTQNLVLDAGYIGTVDSKLSNKTLNNNPNYMAWNTGLLVYDGQTLDVVFRDLKKLYNMEIVADDPKILSQPWTISIDNQSQDTIIRLICASFILSYTKDGNVYHLAKK